MTNTTTHCSATVYSGSRDFRGHDCRNKATIMDQPKRTLGTLTTQVFVGERSEIDILMGVDTRATTFVHEPIYGPVQPVPFCKQHAPSVKAAKQAAELEEFRRRNDAHETASRNADELAIRLRDMMAECGFEVGQYEVQKNYVMPRGGASYVDGIKLSGGAARKLLLALSELREHAVNH
jgi:hypothetical protein